jgi:Uma2 family endonuclease
MLRLDALAPETPRPIRRTEFERMVELGLFEDEGVELLEGVIVTMSPQGPDQADVVTELTEALVGALAGRARVRPQSAYAASETSEPEPDIAVVPPGRHGKAHPDTAYLIVEVARTSRKKDREIKPQIYAASGVDEYWVVDLVDQTIVVHRDPTGEGFRTVTTHGRGEEVVMARFPDVRLAVDRILGEK